MTSTSQPPLKELSESQCWKLLSKAHMGILAVVTEEGPDLFPIDFLATDHTVLFRTAPGEKLMRLAADPRVALAVQGRDPRGRWTIVVRGTARRLAFDDEIESSGVLGLVPEAPGTRANFVRITPTRVTGRRLVAPRAD